MITHNETRLLDGGKISLSVCVETDSDSFTENEQHEIFTQFGWAAQLLLSKLESEMGAQKPRAKHSECDGKDIEKHFGDGSLNDFAVFDSADLGREMVVLSLQKKNMTTPTQITIKYDPDYPWAIVSTKGFQVESEK